MRKNSFSEEEQQFIGENYKGLLTSELTKKLNKKFGTTYEENEVYMYKHNRKMNSGVSTRYAKGCISANKGKHVFVGGRSVETQFKKGHITHNLKPIGTMSRRNYWYIKVNDSPNYHNNWIPYHKYLWEKIHGKTPEGYIVMFLDQNIDNLELENLVLVDKRVQFIVNKKFVLTKDAEINRSILTLAELILKKNSLKNKGEKDGK